MKPTAKPDVDPCDLRFADDGAVDAEIARASKRPYGTPPTLRQWGAALSRTRGLKYRAAHLLGSSHHTLDAALQASAELAAFAAATRERMLDDAEAKLADKAIEEGDGECLRYLLKTVGRSRGYGEKIEATVEVVDGSAVVAKLRAKLANG